MDEFFATVVIRSMVVQDVAIPTGLPTVLCSPGIIKHFGQFIFSNITLYTFLK
jgi:hypothetical protein